MRRKKTAKFLPGLKVPRTRRWKSNGEKEEGVEGARKGRGEMATDVDSLKGIKPEKGEKSTMKRKRGSRRGGGRMG